MSYTVPDGAITGCFGGLGQVAPTAEEVAQGRRDAALANEAGIQVPVLRAVRAVESGASPSAIRFEPHVFWRNRKRLASGASGSAIRGAMTAADMAAVPYTPGSTDWRRAHGLEPCRISRAASCTGSETNRAAFTRAFAIDPAAAVRATSWGSYQVLGGHLLPLFGGDPGRAVQGFDSNPALVSERILVSWMNANPLARLAARTLDFGGFAHRYNGCSDCSAYESRLRSEYNAALPLWRRIESLVGVATPGNVPAWVPWLVAGGVGTLVLGGVAAVTLRHRKG